MAGEPVDELYIDYAYKRLDAKKSGAGSGVTPAADPDGAQEVILYHRALSYVVLKGFSNSLLGDNSSQAFALAAEITPKQQRFHAPRRGVLSLPSLRPYHL